MTIRFHRNDLPDLANYQVNAVAIDTETLGLNPHRDRLCVVQISPGDGSADVIQIDKGQTSAPNLVKLLGDAAITKIFHFGRFDLAANCWISTCPSSSSRRIGRRRNCRRLSWNMRHPTFSTCTG